MAEAFIPTTISETTIYYYFVLPRSSGLPWVLSFAKPGPMGYTTPHKFIFSLNESKSPFLSLATKTLLLGDVTVGRDVGRENKITKQVTKNKVT